MLAQPVTRGHCPVCCGDLESDLVYCARCHTPHHGECWDFSGRCAIYGCSSEQFAGSGAAGSSELVEIQADAERAVPARREAESAEVVQLAGSKRDAFRRWLRELLDEGIGVPTLWTGGPAARKRLALAEPEYESDHRASSRMIVRVQLALVPVLVLIAIFGERGPWMLAQLFVYLALTYALHIASDEGTRRELTLDREGRLELAVHRPLFGTRRTPIADMRSIVAVALLVSRDVESGCPAGVVLLDAHRRPITVPGLELHPHRELPGEVEVDQARALARFLHVSFLGAVDGTGRRRRLPAAETL